IAWLVYDSATHREHAVGPPFAGMPDVDKLDVARQAGATIVAAETLPGLARALAEHGLPLERTRHTLEDYQAPCDRTAEGPLPPPKARFQHPLAEPPFFGLKVCPSLYATYGGLRANAAAEVLDAQGQPLPGVYATGVDLGDVHHRAYAGGLSTGLVFGYLAGERAAFRQSRGLPSAGG